MGQPKILEVDYFALLDKLKAASAVGGRIEKTDKEKWDEFIQANHVNVITIQAWAKVKFMGGKIKTVIISHGSDWDGFYAYSDEDEAALKWQWSET